MEPEPSGGGSRPNPDPTILTTQSLLREIATLKELLQSEISHTRQIERDHLERIQAKFDERSKQMDIALAGQREAANVAATNIQVTIDKMDASYTKLFDQMQVLLTSQEKSYNDKIQDLKGRMDRGEGVSSGGKELWGYVVGAIGLLMTIGTLVTLILREH